jgi:hypothetical protein
VRHRLADDPPVRFRRAAGSVAAGDDRVGLLPTAIWYDALLWLLVISPPPVAGRARDWASRAQTMLTLLTQKAAFVWHNRVSRRALQYDRPRF